MDKADAEKIKRYRQWLEHSIKEKHADAERLKAEADGMQNALSALSQMVENT